MPERPPPRFYGVVTYQDPGGRYSFRYPIDWYKLDLEGKEGVRVGPTLDDPDTWITAWVEPLEIPVVAEDLETLRQGVADGLADLTDCKVEAESEITLGNLIKFERVFTFRENDVVRKRKFWILYVDTWLIVLTWQGVTAKEYEYWLPMANYSYATFQIPEALWFATDRDLFSVRSGASAES